MPCAIPHPLDLPQYWSYPGGYLQCVLAVSHLVSQLSSICLLRIPAPSPLTGLVQRWEGGEVLEVTLSEGGRLWINAPASRTLLGQCGGTFYMFLKASPAELSPVAHSGNPLLMFFLSLFCLPPFCFYVQDHPHVNYPILCFQRVSDGIICPEVTALMVWTYIFLTIFLRGWEERGRERGRRERGRAIEHMPDAVFCMYMCF